MMALALRNFNKIDPKSCTSSLLGPTVRVSRVPVGYYDFQNNCSFDLFSSTDYSEAHLRRGQINRRVQLFWKS